MSSFVSLLCNLLAVSFALFLSLTHTHSLQVICMCVLYALVCVRLWCKFNLILFNSLPSFVSFHFVSLCFTFVRFIRSFVVGCASLHAAFCLLTTFFLAILIFPPFYYFSYTTNAFVIRRSQSLLSFFQAIPIFFSLFLCLACIEGV